MYVSGVGIGWSCAAVGQIVTCTSSTPIAINGTNALSLMVKATQSCTYINKAGVYGGSNLEALNDATAKQ